MSRQGTIESHLSVESTSSYQLSQPSLLWKNEQSRYDDLQQTDTLQQQYEQLKYQLQQQLELQRSQLEREYQLREEQMRQQMMMQWQYISQQQQQQCRAANAHLFGDDPRCCSFPPAAGCTNTNIVGQTVSVQHVQTELTADRRQCGCDGAVSSNVGGLSAAARRIDDDVRPLVVDIVSHTRGRGGGGAWPGHDGGHCRIVVGERPTTESRDGRGCHCRRECDSSDGKMRRRHRVMTRSHCHSRRPSLSSHVYSLTYSRVTSHSVRVLVVR